ncbi:helix-turn-helix domain-containing protein [Hydrogenophaga sp. BPS33]|uniref:helix-turn-helix domain-containing protein n=1 Tax=Hydrogenophaga sp. BPS33 TaxID=2651974 RepID=UPI00131FCAEE|nr:helix-turn-helix domain-containing protein [Hydrogenophaga sp. BPS33]
MWRTQVEAKGKLMSQKEVQRLEVLRRLQSGGLSQSQAAQQLGVSVRQIKRLFAGCAKRVRKGWSRADKASAATGASMKRSKRTALIWCASTTPTSDLNWPTSTCSVSTALASAWRRCAAG